MKARSMKPACALAAAILAMPLAAASLQTYTCDKKVWTAFDETATVTVECPDPAAATWLRAHFAQWYGAHAPRVAAGASGLAVPAGDEAYAAEVAPGRVAIAANTLAGARWASCTLRQLAIAKRGTFRTEGWLLPKLKIADAPHLAFRAVHLCWFPEVRPQQIERAIRLAALLKFNYVILEPWGMFKSEKHPWWSWPQANMTKAEVRRLVAIAKDLGVTLIPQINCYGHATASRGCTLKHSALDVRPEYEPLFEPGGGWNWCLSNPHTQRVLRELIAEMHETFGNPPFFHLGCDEAEKAECPECLKTPGAELVASHIAGLAKFVEERGARAMIWHDMLIDRKDPRWKDFVACGGADATAILERLPKSIIICDWQYSYGKMSEKRNEWPTMKYFEDKGFAVAGCPWMNYNAMKPMADFLASSGGFGMIETTWHRMRGDEWEKMFLSGSHAAWGSPVSHGVPFRHSLRLAGWDAGVEDYRDTGTQSHQVPPLWWAN